MSYQPPRSVYSLTVNGLSLDFEPDLPFDVVANTTRSRIDGGRLASEISQSSMLSQSYDRLPDESRGPLRLQLRRIGPLPTVNAGLLRLVERELMARGESVSIHAPPRRPEKYGSQSTFSIPKFVAENNSGLIRYADDMSLPDIASEIVSAFPNASVAIVTVNKKQGKRIADKIQNRFFVEYQYRSFTPEEVEARVLVGTCSTLEQTYLGTDSRDLILLADPRLCNHHRVEELLYHTHANPRLFVLQKNSVAVNQKVSDRVLQFVGASTLTIGSGNRLKCPVSVTYRPIHSYLGEQGPKDEVALVRMLERQQKRNSQIAKLARQRMNAEPDTTTLVLCASDSHAWLLAKQLNDWTYAYGSNLDQQKIPHELAVRAVLDSTIVPTHRNIICTTASLNALPAWNSKLTIIWAGLRSEPFDLPDRLSWMEPTSQRSIEIIDVQDGLFADTKMKDFDASRCLRRWNTHRRKIYESREWWPVGKDAETMRLDKARKRLVVNTPTPVSNTHDA